MVAQSNAYNSSELMHIEEIRDYPALQQLGRALWKVGSARGAAILVGAGFSRSANRLHANTPDPPLWTDISRAMQARLYPRGTAVLKDPLRLAEEFKALLGESALESLIREMVTDEEWLPGELHKKLVNLPWTDILTTNWDTLIERAALENLGQTYETVRCLEDIATTRAPRIVKLHGSLPSNRPFILSEEDYRTYPRVFAPFVNLVQQTLLENELCLLGFSGDDPNFLEWSGWVRDHLGASARRIHLVGALDLSTAQRRLLESRNISAIDLTPLVTGSGNAKHRAAAVTFLNYLEGAKPRAPWDWPEKRKPTALATPPQITGEHTLAQALETLGWWESQRALFPGWVVCPPAIRRAEKNETIEGLYLLKRAFDQLSPEDRGRLVFEAAWRIDTFFVPLLDWLQPLFRGAVLNNECWSDPAPRLFVAAQLLRTAREERNQSAFAEWIEFIRVHENGEPEIADYIRYQRCLWARDELNFGELRELLIEFTGADPIWKLRHAGLLCDLGDMKGARETFNICLREIRENFYRDRDSVWTISRLAWTQFFSHSVQSWERMFRAEPTEESEVLRLRFFETKADPWETLTALDAKIEEDLRTIGERNLAKEPLFEPGAYRDHTSTIRFGRWWPTEALYEIVRIVDVAGVPARGDHAVIMGARMERAESLTEFKHNDDSDFLRLLRVCQAAGEKLVKLTFSRLKVAAISDDRRAMLDRVLHRALDYAVGQAKRREGFGDDFWSSRAAVYAEIISRLSVRLPSGQAVALFRRGLTYARDESWKSRELQKPLANLLERSLSAVSPSMKPALAFELLDFPLPKEAGIPSQMAQEWPEPADWMRGTKIIRPNPVTQFAARVSALIEIVCNADEVNRTRAILRLNRLYMDGALTSEESVRFGKSLWARRKSEAYLPADTSLYSHMFLLLPSPDTAMARNIFMSGSHEPSSADRLVSLAGASRRQQDGSHELVLTRDEAIKELRGIVAWRPRMTPEFDLGNVRGENDRARQAIGPVLADAILPPLTAEDLTPDLIEGCISLIEKDIAPSAAQGLPELIRTHPALLEKATNTILNMIVSRDTANNLAGFHAAYRWEAKAKERDVPGLPRRIVDTILHIIDARRDPGLLPALTSALQLLNDGILTQEDSERLPAALELVFTETDYSHLNVTEIDTTAITLVRAGAVKLAERLKNLGICDGRLSKLLQDAERDPMPEVRFAAEHSM